MRKDLLAFLYCHVLYCVTCMCAIPCCKFGANINAKAATTFYVEPTLERAKGISRARLAGTCNFDLRENHICDF